MVTIILKEFAAPGNTEKIPNVISVGGQNTNTGVQATDQAAAVTGVGAAVLVPVVYTDDNNTTQRRTIASADIKTII